MSGRAGRVTAIAAGFAVQAGLAGMIIGLFSGSHPGSVAYSSPAPAVVSSGPVLVPYIQPVSPAGIGIVTVTMNVGKQAGIARLPLAGGADLPPASRATFHFRPSTALTLDIDVTIPAGYGVQGFSVTAVPGTWGNANLSPEPGYGMFEVSYPVTSGQQDYDVRWADPAYGPMAAGMIQANGPDWMLVLTMQRDGHTTGYAIAQLHFG